MVFVCLVCILCVCCVAFSVCLVCGSVLRGCVCLVWFGSFGLLRDPLLISYVCCV